MAKPQAKATANPRAIAISALTKVLQRRETLDAFWLGDEFKSLQQRDRAFVKLLLLTTLRHLGQINAMVHKWIKHPLPEDKLDVKASVQLGMAQLLWLKTPAHAAVNEMVTATRESHKGLVNAVLKRAVREGASAIIKQDVSINIPAWLSKIWGQAYGKDSIKAIASTYLSDPYTDIYVHEKADEWARKLKGEALFDHTVRVQAQAIETLEGFEEGSWWVQDVAASLPVMLLENLQGKRVLDIGAAPGGKTMQLVKMGADVTALDKSPKRLKRLEENLARTGLKANILCTGVLDYTPDALFDAIVLDAPCSATGTMKRHPEIAVLKQQEDVDALKMIQRDMLKKAVEFLIPEGEMIYCVCSLQPEEGEQQMDWVSEHLSQLELIPLAVEANSWPDEYITARGELRVLPHYLQSHGGMDGFFAAKFRKRKD